MDQIEALKRVVELAEAMHGGQMPMAISTPKVAAEAVSIVKSLISEVEENASDPIKHGMDFLKSHGSFVVCAVHADGIVERAFHEAKLEHVYYELSPTSHTLTVLRGFAMKAMDKAAKEVFEDGVWEMHDLIQTEAVIGLTDVVKQTYNVHGETVS